MSNWEERYHLWLNTTNLNTTMKQQLLEMGRNKEKVKDAFDKPLPFQDGGMCGILGAGINRMNIYTVRKAVKGLVYYIEKNCVNYKDRGVIIGYDSSYMSKEFALESARVLLKHDIKTYVFSKISPAPLISFAIQFSGAVAGLMVTAGQKPSIYNGLKMYNEKGNQISKDETNEIRTYINQIENECEIEIVEEQRLFDSVKIQWINDEMNRGYLEQLSKITKMDEDEVATEKDLRIVFTPLHGTALNLVSQGLKQLNFNHVSIVEGEAIAVPKFSTVKLPTPLGNQAFTEAIKLGDHTNAHILLATDPNGEQLCVAVRNGGSDYAILSSNQLGALLLDYILMHTDTKVLISARLIKTIVSTEFGRAIAHSYGVETIDTLTGFNNTGEIMHKFNATGETLIFGYEENNGYVISSYSRGNDAIQAAVMACEMTQYWRDKGMSLLDALDELYDQHGYFKEGSYRLQVEGTAAQETIDSFVQNFRQYKHEYFGGVPVKYVEDYLNGTRTYKDTEKAIESVYLPKGNVVKYMLDNQCWVYLAPSETMSEIKWYYGAYSENKAVTDAKLAKLEEEIKSITFHAEVI